jgi:hypothetical protein
MQVEFLERILSKDADVILNCCLREFEQQLLLDPKK